MNNNTHHHAALYHCSLAIAAVAMAITMNSCQDYEYGFTEEEIHQTAIERDYKKEFQKQFPSIDPEHTWMCEPDTLYEEVMVDAMTRAGELPTVPIMTTTPTVFTNMSYTDVQGALGYMEEGKDNRDKAPRDFEYKAIDDSKGEGYEEYTITPTFWGRKFCDNNQVGIYYISGKDANGKDIKQDLGILWSDQNSCIKAYFTDGCDEDVVATDNQIIDDPYWSNPSHSIPLTHQCDVCGNSFFVKDNISKGAFSAPKYVDYDPYNWRSIEIVDRNEQNSNSYDTQFLIKTKGKTWYNGECYKITLQYRVSKTVSNLKIQYQSDLGGYIAYDNNTFSLSQNNAWQTLTITGTISGNGVQTIALDLCKNDPNLKYYFRDIRLESTSNPCSKCNNQGKFPVDHYELPQYTLKVPVGMKWGVYLTTKIQQTKESGTITWYSNSEYNEENKDNSNTKVKAAATFTYNGTTYVSFEDAPTECTNHNGTGTCGTCHRGHWDKDYNDIVLTITPRPVTSTYRSVKYRVMCEDLGGTFDWDFNDVVYDVVYKDGKTTNEKATIEIILQAVGGTLPIYMYYEGAELKKNNNGPSELHEWSTDQTKNNDGLYTPVNVTNCEDVRKCDPVTLKTFTLEKQIYSANELDIRNYAKEIVIKAQQKTGLTSTVKFPFEKGDAIPQCFMTGIGTEWAGELQNITKKYPNFSSWVKNHQNNDWTHESY